MSALTEIQADLGKGVENVKGWIAEIEDKLPAAAEVAARYEASPIVQALLGKVLPPEVESALIALINHFAAEATPADAAAASSTPAASA